MKSYRYIDRPGKWQGMMTVEITQQKPQSISDPYTVAFKKINGIDFTRREIDVLACLISGRSLKGISNFLGIHYKTLEVHMGNIRQKLGYSVRDYIVEALEGLPEHGLLKYRYQQLQQSKHFDDILKTARPSKELEAKGLNIFYHPTIKECAQRLRKQLAPLSCTIVLRKGTPHSQTKDHPPYIFLTSSKERDSTNAPWNSATVCMEESVEGKNTFYYHILKILQPSLILTTGVQLESLLSDQVPAFDLSIRKTKKIPFKNPWVWGLLLLLALGLFLMRSTIFPSTSVYAAQFLMRPSLQQTLKRAFKPSETAKNPSVILVGPGGIGKTTTARIFLESQGQKLCWEMNGESHTTLINDYINLASHLAHRLNLKGELDDILSIKSVALREKNLLCFLQKHLQKYSWVLLYDNVEDGQDLLPYLPIDSGQWGRGKIIITTRDQTKATQCFAAEVLPIPILTPKEKLALFSKFYAGAQENLKSTINFLTHIPPFPLDVSLAAAYLNAIDISYGRYLTLLKMSSDDFNRLQSSLHYQGGYQTTRHQIIRHSLASIIKINEAHKGLSVASCLLDAEDLSPTFLESYGSKQTVDAFIGHMKKHSLLNMNKHTPESFFMHRSTQHHGLIYLGDILSPTLLESSVGRLMEVLEKTYQRNIGKEKSHILVLLRHIEAFKGKLKKFPIRSTLKDTMTLRLNILRMYIYDKALSHVQKVKTLLLKILPLDEKVRFLSTQKKREIFMDLGRMHGLSGSFHEAIRFYEKSLKIAKKSRNIDHMGQSLIAIGFEYVWLNEFEKAKTYLLEGLRYVESLSKDSPKKLKTLATAYSYLGTLYSTRFLDQADGYRQSLAFLEKAHTLMQQASQDPRALLRIYRNKAQTYCRAKRYEEAMQKAILPARKILATLKGPSHTLLHLVLDSCEGEILLRQGKTLEAQALLERVVSKYQQLLGNEGAFMALYPFVHYIEALVKNGDMKQAAAFATRATHMRNPAHTNFHKRLYVQLRSYKTMSALEKKDLPSAQ